MPTYQYRCRSCDEFLEVFQKFSEDSLTTCPACGEEQLRKVYNAVGVVFKGSGFYKTDSRKDAKSSSGAPTAKANDSADSSSKSSESNSSGSSSSGSSADSTGSGAKSSQSGSTGSGSTGSGSTGSGSKPKVDSRSS